MKVTDRGPPGQLVDMEHGHVLFNAVEVVVVSDAPGGEYTITVDTELESVEVELRLSWWTRLWFRPATFEARIRHMLSMVEGMDPTIPIRITVRPRK